nr:hypothetical protein [Gemmobacter aquatilis]
MANDAIFHALENRFYVVSLPKAQGGADAGAVDHKAGCAPDSFTGGLAMIGQQREVVAIAVFKPDRIEDFEVWPFGVTPPHRSRGGDHSPEFSALIVQIAHAWHGAEMAFACRGINRFGRGDDRGFCWISGQTVKRFVHALLPFCSTDC